MKSLSACLKKFGKNINEKDIEFIRSARQDYVDAGLNGEQATDRAINDFIDILSFDLKNLEKEIVDEGGSIAITSYSISNSKEPRKNSEQSLKWQSIQDEDNKPYYQGDGFILSPVASLHDKKMGDDHKISIDEGMEGWAVDIVTPDGADSGTMAIQIDPSNNQINAIYDIDIHEKNKGLGSKVIKQILANTNKPIKIVNILDSSWNFWQKMGVSKRDEKTKDGWLRQGDKPRLPKKEDAKPIKAPESEPDTKENAEKPVDKSDPFDIPPEDTKQEKAIRYIQNKFLPLKRVQEAITDKGKIIADDMNAYVKEELMHEKASLDLEVLQDNHIEKIVNSLADSDISQTELDLFLYARHARERNKFIAERNEELPDGGSGMTNKQAVDILRQFQHEGKTNELESIADMVYAMLKDKSDRLERFGVLSKKQNESWNDMFEFYIPLKGFQDDGGDTETAYIGKTGKGFNIQGKESMRAMGRRSMSASPLITAIQDSTSAIMRARKNEVGQAFLKLVKDNPNAKYWTIHTQKNPGVMKNFNKDKNQVEEIKLNLYQMGQDKEKYMGVKVEGEQVYIGMEDKRLAKAMNNMGNDATNGIIQMMAKATRILSSLNTSLNPEFMISNMARDIQTAMFNALAESDRDGGKLEGKLKTKKEKLAFAAKMASPNVVFGAMRGINKAIKDHKSKGKWQKHWHDFRKHGAKTGYFDMKDFDAQARDIENMIKMAEGGLEGNLRKFSKGVFGAVDRINTAVENAIRLSAYVHAVEAGLTKQKAASLAKNLTVNFNRKGEISWLNAIYMFGNASVQGTAQFLRSIASNPMNHPSGKKFKLSLAQKAGVVMSASGYAFAMMNRELGGEDEDGEKWVDKIPDYVVERNLVIMKSVFGGKEDGSYWTIPLPYGYNIFHNIGTALESVNHGSKRKSLSWASRFVSFSALGSFSPIGMNTSEKGVETALAKTATPTLFKPFIEMAVDENFFGSPIYRNSTFDRFTKRDSIGKANTSEHWKLFSNLLSDMTGGTKLKGGFIDIAPESFKHLVTSFSGGLGRLGDNTVGLVGDLAAGNEIESRKIPFYRKISGNPSSYAGMNDFYDRKDEVYRVHDEMKMLKGKDKILFRRENKQYIDLYSLARSTEKKLRALRKQKKAIEAGNNINSKIKLQRVQDKMDLAVKQFNLKYNQLFN